MVPPFTVKSTEPLEAELQVTLTFEVEVFNAAGSTIWAEIVVVQLLLSVSVRL